MVHFAPGVREAYRQSMMELGLRWPVIPFHGVKIKHIADELHVVASDSQKMKGHVTHKRIENIIRDLEQLKAKIEAEAVKNAEWNLPYDDDYSSPSDLPPLTAA
ncbi:MAG: hypothetical protein CL581_14100 [Alteromonadaceae bacterium]|nr:hypothetical protein [Alteromonadaceae bacterium]